MRNRLLSLLLVVMMLFGIIVSTASCAMLEDFVGEEHLGDDYLDKYRPGEDGTDEEDPDKNPPDEEPDNDPPTEEVENKGDPDVPKKDGYNQITFFWKNSSGPISYDLETCDIWVWYGDVAGKGYLMKECSYGGMLTLNIPEDVEEVGFIVRTDCSDPGGTTWGTATKNSGNEDLFAIVEGEETFIYLKPNDANQYHSTDGGKTTTVIKKFSLAGMTTVNTIKYTVTPKTTITSMDQIKVMEGDKELTITNVTNLNRANVSGVITVAEDLDIGKTYTVFIEGYGEATVVPTTIFDTDYFAENYNYDGDDLGATINGNGTTTFKVWAPTASKVVLNLFKSGTKGESDPSDTSVEMVRGDKGVWSYTANCGHGTYYTYTVTTGVGTQEAVDPYAKSAGVNGDRGMVVDLSLTNPVGWEEDYANFSTGIESYSDAIIWEIHVRDFSNMIESCQNKGKYLAFTETGLVNEHGQSVGIDYLKELGINFVHLLPVYDYATVNEANPNEGFNWGYDPKNYNVPEGSYSSNPYDGAVRIMEYKQMVMALHEAGIGVVMDVVYNHTYDKNASFNKIVPYYYYRYTATGANSNASGCGNDTASERYMYGKFMVDSVSYWLKEYNLDGFRFDLMGLHDLQTMQEVESAVHTIDKNAIIYGEGWTMGSTIDGSAQANQGNISKITATNGAIGTIAVFNDAIRDGLKGSTFEETSKGYISGAANAASRNKVVFGVKGGVGSGMGWQVKNAMVVNYMSAHDNNTLWDKFVLSNGSDPVASRLAMNRLGATIIMVSRGMVFFQAGEEMLRTKPLEDGGFDHNSYMSPDSVNNIKWDSLKPGSDEHNMMLYYKGLIAIRNNIDIFSAKDIELITENIAYDGFAVKLNDYNGGKAIVIVNPSMSATLSYNFEGEYHMICSGSEAGTTSIQVCNGSVSVPACSAVILVTENLLPTE